MANIRMHIVYGAISFILLVFMVVGLSYCSHYKVKSRELSEKLGARNADNEGLINQISSLRQDLEKAESQLKAKITEADMLEEALTDLRKRMSPGGTGQEKPK
jgi:predicted nuclease with TOPRIM domain